MCTSRLNADGFRLKIVYNPKRYKATPPYFWLLKKDNNKDIAEYYDAPQCVQIGSVAHYELEPVVGDNTVLTCPVNLTTSKTKMHNSVDTVTTKSNCKRLSRCVSKQNKC